MITYRSDDRQPHKVRWTAARKTRVVREVVAGRSVTEVARGAGVAEADVVRWVDLFVEGGRRALRGTPAVRSARPTTPVGRSRDRSACPLSRAEGTLW
jgi:transposase-like protein